MTKKKPCRVEITRTNHKDQPFVVTIDKPGKTEPYKLKQRYSTRWSAKRGAIRNLKAWLHSKAFTGSGVYAYGDAPKITFVQFVFTTSKRRK